MALDRFVVDKTGAEMVLLYQDLNEGCLSEVQNQCKHEKAKSAQMELQASIPESPSPSARIEQRKEKSITRPPHSPVYSIAPTAETSEDKGKPEKPSPVFKVRPDTFEVFSVLFKPSPDILGIDSMGCIRGRHGRLEIHHPSSVRICLQVRPSAGRMY